MSCRFNGFDHSLVTLQYFLLWTVCLRGWGQCLFFCELWTDYRSEIITVASDVRCRLVVHICSAVLSSSFFVQVGLCKCWDLNLFHTTWQTLMREKGIEKTGTRLNHCLSPSSQISPLPRSRRTVPWSFDLLSPSSEGIRLQDIWPA